MSELKSKIEAILLCSHEGIDTKSLARACGLGAAGHVKSAVKELQEDYNKRGAGIAIIQRDNLWFFSVKDEHLELVKETSRPEVNKAVLETLAYIAHKKNIRQSDVIRIRSNKAYAHIKELLERGLIEAKKEGSTKRLLPAKKFYEYFDLKEDEELIPGEKYLVK